MNQQYLETVQNNLRSKIALAGYKSQSDFADEMSKQLGEVKKSFSKQRLTDLLKGRARWDHPETSLMLSILECEYTDIFPLVRSEDVKDG